MAEKTIIGKMTVYETLTMVVPGAMIVFCVWLMDPNMWGNNLCRSEFIDKQSYLFDSAIVLVLFALSYVAGLLNYRLIDWFWGKIGMRNNVCMIKGSLQDKVDSEFYEHVKTLVKNQTIESMNNKQVEDIYYEAYTYALKQNANSNVPHLENQVAMLKGLIVPMLWLILKLSPETWGHYNCCAAAVVVIVLVVLAITRQKKIINLVLEDYEYENRIDPKQ